MKAALIRARYAPSGLFGVVVPDAGNCSTSCDTSHEGQGTTTHSHARALHPKSSERGSEAQKSPVSPTARNPSFR